MNEQARPSRAFMKERARALTQLSDPQVTALRLAVERAESEREFYFEKLQDIELLCQRPAFAGNPVRPRRNALLHCGGARESRAPAVTRACPNSKPWLTPLAGAVRSAGARG